MGFRGSDITGMILASCLEMMLALVYASLSSPTCTPYLPSLHSLYHIPPAGWPRAALSSARWGIRCPGWLRVSLGAAPTGR